MKRILLYSFLAILICLSILVSLFIFEVNLQKRYVRNSLKFELDKTQNLITQHLEQTHKIINSIVKEVKRDHRNLQYVEKILSSYKTNQLIARELPWTVFSWTDENNMIVVDTTYGLSRQGEFDISGRDYVKYTQKEFLKFFIGKPVIGITSKKWVIPAGVGASLNGKYIGTLAIGFEIEILANLVNREIKNHDVKFTLIDQRPRKIFSDFDNKIIVYKDSDESIIKSPEILAALEEDEIFYTDIFDGNKGIFLGRKSQDLPFFFLMEYDQKKFKQQLFESYFDKIKILGLIFTIIFVIFFAARSSFH